MSDPADPEPVASEPEPPVEGLPEEAPSSGEADAEAEAEGESQDQPAEGAENTTAEYGDESFANDEPGEGGEGEGEGGAGEAETEAETEAEPEAEPDAEPEVDGAPLGEPRESRATAVTATTAAVNDAVEGAVASAAELSQDLPDDMLLDAEAEAAAVKIQAAHRGRAARAEVAAMRAARATTEEEGDDMPDLNDEDLQAAAVKIQAAQRGRAARAEVAAMRAAMEGEGQADAENMEGQYEDELPDLNDEELQAAAVKIQAAQRGRAARAEVAAMKAAAQGKAEAEEYVEGGEEMNAEVGPDEGEADGPVPPPPISSDPKPAAVAAQPFTKENKAPDNAAEGGGAQRGGEALFTRKQPVHAYLAQNIQLAVRHALRALSSQRPEEPFILAADVIRNWTPDAVAPRLSRPAGGATVGAREYLEQTSILKVLHDGMCAMAKTRPQDPRQFLADYLLDHAPVPAYVQAMENFGTEEQLAKMDALHKGAREVLDGRDE